MLFYLAALQSVSTDVYEAAAIDNTSRWRAFWRITFPLLKPAHFFVLVIFGVGALKIFDQAFIVSNGSGGPNYATMTGVGVQPTSPPFAIAVASVLAPLSFTKLVMSMSFP